MAGRAALELTDRARRIERVLLQRMKAVQGPAFGCRRSQPNVRALAGFEGEDGNLWWSCGGLIHMPCESDRVGEKRLGLHNASRQRPRSRRRAAKHAGEGRSIRPCSLSQSPTAPLLGVAVHPAGASRPASWPPPAGLRREKVHACGSGKWFGNRRWQGTAPFVARSIGSANRIGRGRLPVSICRKNWGFIWMAAQNADLVGNMATAFLSNSFIQPVKRRLNGMSSADCYRERARCVRLTP